ncbi:MAG: signal peptidase II [Bariatricus sp.]
MNKRLKKYISAVAGVLVLLLLDQYAKILALRYLKDQPAFVIWKGVFELQYLENRGSAFGMMQNRRYFFLIMTVIVLGIMVYLYSLTPVTRRYLPLRICMVFLAAGAAGNFIDRLIRGFVVDFFYFSLIDFPIFNVADIYITVTFFVLVLLIFFYYKEEDLMIYSRQYRKEHQM